MTPTPRPLAPAVLLALGALALAGCKESGDRGWRSYLRRYNVLQRAAGAAPVAMELHRIAGSEREGRRERCVGCHLGMVLPGAHDEPPFGRHPPLDCRLPPRAIGCVACHRGNPRATSLGAAHGTARSGDAQRLLGAGLPPEIRARRRQAACAQCHLDRSAGLLRYDARIVPAVARGQRLFVEQGCPACHRVAGMVTHVELGPRLGEVGARRSLPAILERLRRAGRTPGQLMPPVTVDAAAREALAIFLAAQVGPRREAGTSVAAARVSERVHPRLVDHVDAVVPDRPNAAAGAIWAQAAGCRGCHRLDGTPVGVPDLRRVGWYATAEELRQTLREPRRRFTGTRMPPFELPAAVVESLVLYLRDQRQPLPSAPVDVLRSVCGPCHGPGRDPKVNVLARRPPPLSAERIDRARFVEAVQNGRAKTACPPWGRVMSPRFIEQLYRLLPRTR